MRAFGGWARSSCNILYPRWHHVRCGCVLRCAAYNIPVFAVVSTCVRTLLTLRAIPWCACPRRWRLRCASGDRPMKQTSVFAHRLSSSLCSLNFFPLREFLNMCATWSICSHE